MTARSEDTLEGREDAAPIALLLGPLDGRPGPARRLSSSGSDALIDAVLAVALDGADRAGAEGAAPAAALAGPLHPLRTPPPELPQPARAPRQWRRTVGLAAAAGLVFFAGTGASALAWRLLHVELGDPEPAPPAPRPERRRAVPPGTRPAEEVAVPSAIVEPQPEEDLRPAPRQRVQPASEPAQAAPVVIVPENLPPEDLLASANERRQRREYRAADAFYGAVVTRFSGTDAAMVAEVASAALHLQHLGDVSGALEVFRRTLGSRPSGPLAEEARWGIAEAQRALGDAQGEAQALREFLERHPHSALAPAAQRRLSRIGP